MQIKNPKIDLACAIVTHKCSKKCKFCVDNFLNTYDTCLDPKILDKFIKMLKQNTDWKSLEEFNPGKQEVLFLGGEPTEAPEDLLIDYAKICKQNNVLSLMSTNGVNKSKIESLLPYYDWMQISIFNDSDLEYWSKYPNANAKLVVDRYTTWEKLNNMIDKIHKYGYKRSTITFYTDDDGNLLTTDSQILNWLKTLDFKVIWNTYYTFYEGIRIKKPNYISNKKLSGYNIPMVYPNGNYNGTWEHENLDDYIANSNW